MQRIVSRPTTLALSLAALKKHCRVAVDDDDDLIEMYAKAAQLALFERTGIAPQPMQLELTFDNWNYCSDSFTMRAYPFRSIDSVEYRATDGDYTVVEDLNYQPVKSYYGAYALFKDDFVFPDLYESFPADLVRIRFSAGYDNQQVSGSGDDPELQIPENVQMAICFLVGHWYNNREDVVDEEKFTVPKAFDFIANQLRIYS